MQKRKFAGLLLALLVWLAPLAAQSAPQQSTATSATSARSRSWESKALDSVVPADLVVQGSDTKVAPLTTAQKFGEVGKNFANPFTFVGTAFQTGIDQAADIHQGYGQGAAGFGKRYGANIADTASAQLFGYGVYPSVFHTDPRYYRMGSGGIFKRGFYAGSRILITRTDSGRRVFNTPEILAAATSSGISRAYYPSDERNFGDFAFNMASRIAFDAIYNGVKEFWPDVRKRVFRGR
ncbi:MAG TPA: hypothetical protein VFQ00_01870 [Terriglobales bacterium]|nr:hypothetical protein [Terriglobales bacterium]